MLTTEYISTVFHDFFLYQIQIKISDTHSRKTKESINSYTNPVMVLIIVIMYFGINRSVTRRSISRLHMTLKMVLLQKNVANTSQICAQ